MTEVRERRSHLRLTVEVLGGLLAAMWVIEIVDTLILGGSLQGHGIYPRTFSELDGILFAPFLHGDWAHISANSVPFLVLGALVMLRGLKAFLAVSAVVIVVAGLGTWVIGKTGNHIGASGVIFGYFGYLLAAGIFERSLKAIVIAVGVGFAYGGLILGVLPCQPGISWEGHLTGFVGGALAARWGVGRHEPAAGADAKRLPDSRR